MSSEPFSHDAAHLMALEQLLKQPRSQGLSSSAQRSKRRETLRMKLLFERNYVQKCT